jgi:hypothetical protein
MAATAFAALAVGIMIIAATTGYTANPKRRGAPSLWIALLVMAGMALRLVGMMVIAAVCASLLAGRNEIGRLAVWASAFILFGWLSDVVIQLAQNLFYRFVGAPTQRLRWWNYNLGHSRKKKRAVEQA